VQYVSNIEESLATVTDDVHYKAKVGKYDIICLLINIFCYKNNLLTIIKVNNKV